MGVGGTAHVWVGVSRCAASVVVRQTCLDIDAAQRLPDYAWTSAALNAPRTCYGRLMQLHRQHNQAKSPLLH